MLIIHGSTVENEFRFPGNSRTVAELARVTGRSVTGRASYDEITRPMLVISLTGPLASGKNCLDYETVSSLSTLPRIDRDDHRSLIASGIASDPLRIKLLFYNEYLITLSMLVGIERTECRPDTN